MDTAITQENLSTQQLTSINNCRLHYKVIYLGDMADHDGQYIRREYITHGKGQPIREELQIDFPSPEIWQWKTWAEFILKNYVNGDMSLAHNLGSRQTTTINVTQPHQQHKFSEVQMITKSLYKQLMGN